MNVWIMTDMEGLAGVDDWEQCYAPADDDPRYRYGLRQLVADTRAAVEGALAAGAERVMVCDGHGRNGGLGFDRGGGLPPRAIPVGIRSQRPFRFEGLDASTDAVVMIGQHAMAGTIHGFLDHTQSPKRICRMQVNGVDIGEFAQLAIHAGAFGVPLVFASGDEALCAEAQRLIPGIATTATKRGTGWATCELYDSDAVRQGIRHTLAAALRARAVAPLQLPIPGVMRLELAWSELADPYAALPEVRRVDGRTIEWPLRDARDIFMGPAAE